MLNGKSGLHWISGIRHLDWPDILPVGYPAKSVPVS
jgi:hypothetical protein